MIKFTAVAAALVFFVSAFFVYGRHAHGGVPEEDSGWESESRYNDLYNARRTATLEGTVTGILVTPTGDDGSYGVNLMLQTDETTVPVHLGPQWFVERNDLQLVTGDRVRVTGSRIILRGRPAVIAAEVRKGSEVLVLREKDGTPRWGSRKTSVF